MIKLFLKTFIYILLTLIISKYYINSILINLIIINLLTSYITNKINKDKSLRYKYLYLIILNILKDLVLGNIIFLELIIIIISQFFIENNIFILNKNNYIDTFKSSIIYNTIFYINKLFIFKILNIIKINYINFHINEIICIIINSIINPVIINTN